MATQTSAAAKTWGMVGFGSPQVVLFSRDVERAAAFYAALGFEEVFRTPEELRKVKGIGEKLYDRLKDQITVEPSAPSRGHGG